MNSFDLQSEEYCATDIILAFLGGAALGAGAALLLAPASGRETRETLRELPSRAKRWVTDLAGGGEEDEEGWSAGGENEEDAVSQTYPE